ncbi:LysE family translocator [Ruegeria marina]|uniref:Threonine/homoserine/homoserine lactone efflux protein n=1 Tax=Ruegeria marina TaxID=639004 RepID=A0A1G7AHJ0_9RHOB|nr:LysE family translocator [Ruegeria marina]SDE14173.1 Threonine/homoserine/homoserine lactone efflux protein [Ruegeria marina]
MTLSVFDLALYAGAVFILFLTPGPVWLALTARTLSGGFNAAWPLTLGVVVGDSLWPVLAILGVGWITAASTQIAIILKFVAVIVFVTLGLLTIRNADRTIANDSRLTRPGVWAGFLAGLVVILGNPKAVLFYMGILPGFFDLANISTADIVAIVVVSQVVPLVGNLMLAAFVDRVRRVLNSPRALRRMNLTAGAMLIAVGLILPFT